MYKRLIMEAQFEAVPISGEDISNILEKEIGYIDVGGFGVKVPGYKNEIPFDFESTTFCSTTLEEHVDHSYSFGNWDGLGEKIFDVDPCYEDDWAENGLKPDDITAELLASAEELTEFYFCLSNMQDESIHCYLKVKAMYFTNERDKTFQIKQEVLEKFNKKYVAEMVADFIETVSHKSVDRKTKAAIIEDYVGKFNSKEPAGTLALVHALQDLNCTPEQQKEAEFLIDNIMQVSESKPYRVGLIAMGDIDRGGNPYETLLGVKSGYFYGNDIRDCQYAVIDFIEKNALGAGQWAGGLVFKGNEYVGGVSYNGQFWDKDSRFYSLAKLKNGSLLDIDKLLRTNMPVFSQAVEKQVIDATLEKMLDVQILKADQEDRSAHIKEPEKDISEIEK